MLSLKNGGRTFREVGWIVIYNQAGNARGGVL